MDHPVNRLQIRYQRGRAGYEEMQGQVRVTILGRNCPMVESGESEVGAGGIVTGYRLN